MSTRRERILIDFYNKHCIEKQISPISGEELEGHWSISPKTPDVVISGNYESYPDDLKMILSCAHSELNSHLDFMRYKSGSNQHFNADDSRELYALIDDLRDLFSELKKDACIITIEKTYLNWIRECATFLKLSCGSHIPENLFIPKNN